MRYAVTALLFSSLLVGCASTSNSQSASTSRSNSQSASAASSSPSGATQSADTGLLLLPGTTYAEMTVNPDGSITLQQVAELTAPEKTIVFKFEAAGSDTQLSIKNPLAQAIKYRLDMLDMTGKPYPTGTCPVRPSIMAIEIWPHPIPALRVTQVHIPAPDKQSACVY